MNDICENVCPCTECRCEQEECVLAESFIKLKEARKCFLDLAMLTDIVSYQNTK